MAFEENYRFLPRRKNGNALYHEVIVLEQEESVAPTRQAEILLALAERYCEMRAPGQLAYGRVHQDQKHQHIHLMLSSNGVRSPRRARLPKARFAEIQRELEAFKLERFPELSPLRIYDRKEEGRQTVKSKNREQQAKAREKRPSQKQRLGAELERILKGATSRQDLEARLAAQNLQLYQRGKSIGVESTIDAKRHRLKTLGLEAEWGEAEARFDRSAPQIEPQKDRPKLSPETPQPVDPRADDLLRRRALEHAARDRLDGFDLER